MSDALLVRAPAKLNLFLEVLGRRADGFHELDSVMIALERADLLRMRARDEPGVELTLSGSAASEDVPRGADNLVVRALAGAFADAGGPGPGLSIELEKRVPSRAGLGGGSADAAAALLGARRLLGVERTDEQCARELARLGSDCAFFAAARASGAARCRGRGELVEAWPAPSAALHFAVLVPTPECPTPLVYASLPTHGALPAPSALASALALGDVDAIAHALHNRLEEGALRAVPALAAWRELFDSRAGESWILSGSGSAFFSVFPHEADARSALMEIQELALREGLSCREAFCSQPAGMGVSLAEIDTNCT